jgi:hypothetical protein
MIPSRLFPSRPRSRPLGEEESNSWATHGCPVIRTQSTNEAPHRSRSVWGIFVICLTSPEPGEGSLGLGIICYIVFGMLGLRVAIEQRHWSATHIE